jgi:hypothetical protein
MMDAVYKYEHVPHRREMIHDPMMLEIISRSNPAPRNGYTAALCDWIFLGQYNGI